MMHKTDILKQAYLVGKLVLELQAAKPEMFASLPAKRFTMLEKFITTFESGTKFADLKAITNLHEILVGAYKGKQSHKPFVGAFSDIFNVK